VSRNDPGHWFEAEPLWFKTAVFYEIHTRAFFDANGDGSGDFRGLIEKLDYLQWLGVDVIWLLPFYKSPLRDGGYDIADFFTIQPDYGTVDDVRDFMEAAHQRGIRVIADLVMNHTSSDHPWFQESRSSPDNPKRDWYVWSDTYQKYEDARIIFTDTESSNWTWDDEAGAYFWHRFFSHQPDLNYDNPEVQEAMLEVLRFWLDLGMDGFRLDAVPYLYEREGTNGENLPETHEYLKRVRAEIDAKYPDRVLLAEANQWPADVVEYFGDGDECHMAFHFPVMPRMFMALRREEANPIYEILRQTPDIPHNCQWGLFLRNHDELTLEMVTDEERDYMYGEYAKDPRMKINVGIRRRLTGPVLRRRDHDGRQRLPRRPRRRAHADAVDGRPQRRLQPCRLRAALRAAADGSGLRVPGRQRRGAAAHADLAAALAAALHLAAQGAPGLRPRHVRAARAVQQQDLRPSAHLRGRRDAVRAQPRALGAGRGAGPLGLRGPAAGRGVRAVAVPEDRRAAVPADAGTARLLLVPAHRGSG
jgi:alpha amylase-like protein